MWNHKANPKFLSLSPLQEIEAERSLVPCSRPPTWEMVGLGRLVLHNLGCVTAECSLGFCGQLRGPDVGAVISAPKHNASLWDFCNQWIFLCSPGLSNSSLCQLLPAFSTLQYRCQGCVFLVA